MKNSDTGENRKMALVTLGHLPPMTEEEFAAYMAAQTAEVDAHRAFCALANRLGAAAHARGTPYDACPDDNSDRAFVREWRGGWSDAHGPIGEDELAG